MNTAESVSYLNSILIAKVDQLKKKSTLEKPLFLRFSLPIL